MNRVHIHSLLPGCNVSQVNANQQFFMGGVLFFANPPPFLYTLLTKE